MPSTDRNPGGRTGALACRAALAAAALSACDLPTELPKWETLWVVPGETTAIPVESLLPAELSPAPEGSAFLLEVGAATFSRSLGEICPVCERANGATVPKPAFSVTFGSEVPLPADIVSANLASGLLLAQVQHDFGFDPLRPGADARGFLLITASSDGAVVARDSVSGTDTAFPPGTTLSRTLTLDRSVISGRIAVDVTVFSPAGDPVRIDTAQRITVVAQPRSIRIEEARLRIASQEVTSTEVELGTEGVDRSVVDRVRGGALLLQVDNPLGIAGNLVVTIQASGSTIRKPIQLQTGESALRVEFTREEMQALLGGPARLSATGTVSAPSGTTTIRPGQTASIRSRLELTIGPREG